MIELLHVGFCPCTETRTPPKSTARYMNCATRELSQHSALVHGDLQLWNVWSASLLNFKLTTNVHFFCFFFSQLYDLIKRTATTGESNSLLVIGPRGCGKTMVNGFFLKYIYIKKKPTSFIK